MRLPQRGRSAPRPPPHVTPDATPPGERRATPVSPIPGSSPAPHKLIGIGPGPRPFAAPAAAPAAPRRSGLTRRFDDSDDDGDEPEDPLAKEAPPLRIDDNDGRPLGPPSMAAIMGAPGMADPFQWRPPRNLCVAERAACRARYRRADVAPWLGMRGPCARARGELDLSPLPWSNFFERSRDVQIPGTNNVR